MTFSKRPGDGLEGHEIWQSSNTAVHGLGGRTGTLGGRNPAIALSNKDHKIVNAIQRQIIRSSHEISPLDNIKMNIQVLRETQKRGVNVTNAQIKEAGRKAVRFYERMKSEGHLN